MWSDLTLGPFFKVKRYGGYKFALVLRCISLVDCIFPRDDQLVSKRKKICIRCYSSPMASVMVKPYQTTIWVCSGPPLHKSRYADGIYTVLYLGLSFRVLAFTVPGCSLCTVLGTQTGT